MLAFAKRSAIKHPHHAVIQSSCIGGSFIFPLSAFRASYSLTNSQIGDKKTTKRKFRYGEIKHSKSGKKYQADTENLNAKSLGKAAKVLIISQRTEDELPKSSSSTIDDQITHETKSSTGQSVTNVITSVGREKVELDDALAAIETLRPQASDASSPVFIPRSEASELAKTLQQQFSVVQLREYARRSGKNPEYVEASPFDRPLPERWAWDETLVVARAGVKIGNFKDVKKATVVSRILENSWGLRIISAEAEAFSAFRNVSEKQQKLLTLGSPSILDEISASLSIKCQHKSRPRRPDFRLALGGKQNALVLASNQIESLLNASQGLTQQISLKKLQVPSPDWPDRKPTDRIDISEEDLRQLSNQTGALITRRGLRKQEQSSPIVSVSIDGIRPERILAAKQALIPLTQYRASTATSALVIGEKSAEESSLIKSLAPIRTKLQPPYHKFSQRRIVQAGTTGSYKLFKADHGSIYSIVEPMMGRFTNPKHENLPTVNPFDVQPLWRSEISGSATIDLGYVMHNGSLDDESVSLVKSIPSKTLISTSPFQSFFHESAPNANHLFHRLPQLGDSTKRTIKVRISAVPDMSFETKDALNAPDLSFTFALDIHKPGPAKWQHGSASLAHEQCYIMLPGAPVDLRIATSIIREMNIQAQLDEELQQFINTISARLGAGEPIGHLPGFDLMWPPNATATTGASRIKYMVAGVKQRETVSFRVQDPNIAEEDRVFQNHIASYAVAKSGSSGRISQALRLHLPYSVDDGGSIAHYKSRVKRGGNEFVRTACWLVDELTAAQPRMEPTIVQKQVDDFGIY